MARKTQRDELKRIIGPHVKTPPARLARRRAQLLVRYGYSDGEVANIIQSLQETRLALSSDFMRGANARRNRVLEIKQDFGVSWDDARDIYFDMVEKPIEDVWGMLHESP